MKRILFFCCICLCFVLATQPAQASMCIPITVGEHHVYKVKWLGLTVGQFEVTVLREDTFQGRQVYVIEMRGGTNRFCSHIYRIRDHFVSYIDKETFRPLKLEVSRREGGYKKDAVTLYFHDEGKAYFHNYLDKSSKEYDIPKDIYDVIGVFFRLRAEQVQLKKEITYDVDFGETIFSASGMAEKKEKIKLPNGKKVMAYFAEPKAYVGSEEVKDGSVRAYFSSDVYTIPLYITLKAPLFTKITATLETGTALL